uniref:NFX1-type zinc finger-containing protein 1 n=1 Tax=Lygus hesperus TaxID=30085 RepID=A0A146LAG0_LYGHE
MDEAKLELLRTADVVGLTTTGCAMNQNLLRSLRPSVLVVEEAAEVLESQLLACMTDTLTQVVLIGDHFQLKPKVDTFVYEKYNHMNTSLFERLATTSHTLIRLT